MNLKIYKFGKKLVELCRFVTAHLLKNILNNAYGTVKNAASVTCIILSGPGCEHLYAIFIE